uniref:Biotin-protein ligase n=1 Tax=Vibrio coralliilyticus TaxID=190893 RepID=M1FTP1_9VIBR|nr:HTH domain-containing protein [Vibrio coralliilyticus]AFV27407.1 Biotin-protein ligase [Vibrio coralliilyticus]
MDARSVNMTTKEKVLVYLIEHKGEVVSGQELADKLAISRTSIWKAIKTLQTEGYQIEATTNKGYLLAHEPDVLSKSFLYSQLTDKPDVLEVHKQVGSTNDEAKKLVTERFVGKGVLLAEEQTNVRGRLDWQCYSHIQTGLYMQNCYPNKQQANAGSVTTAAAGSVCKAIEKLGDKKPSINRLNDIFFHHFKISGLQQKGSSTLKQVRLIPSAEVLVIIKSSFQDSRRISDSSGSIYTQEETSNRDLSRGRMAYAMANRLIFLYLFVLFEQWRDTGGLKMHAAGYARPSNESRSE